MHCLLIKQIYNWLLNLSNKCRRISYASYITEHFVDHHRPLCHVCVYSVGSVRHTYAHFPHCAVGHPHTQFIDSLSPLQCDLCCIFTCFNTAYFMSLHSTYVHVQLFMFHHMSLCQVMNNSLKSSSRRETRLHVWWRFKSVCNRQQRRTVDLLELWWHWSVFSKAGNYVDNKPPNH